MPRRNSTFARWLSNLSDDPTLLTQPWLLTILLIQTAGWWIYAQAPAIDRLNMGVYFLSFLASGSFWYLLNVGRDAVADAVGRPGRALVASLLGPVVAILVVGNYKLFVEFGEFFSGSMLQYAGRGGTSTLVRYVHEYLYFPMNLVVGVTLPAVAGIWYWGSRIEFDSARQRATTTLTTFFIFIASLVATTALAPRRHVSLDTSLMTAALQTLYAPERAELRKADREKVPSLPEEHTTNPPNVVLIVNESLGIHELELSGSRNDQMPRLQNRVRRSPGQFFHFERAYANSTSTDLSVPSLLTGVGPYESTERLHTMPLVWDWARTAGLRPFYISAQNYSSTNFHEFFFENDPIPVVTPNSLYERESGDFRADEIRVSRQFGKQLAKVPEDEPFFAVYNSNAMHKPFQQSSPLLDSQPARGTPYRNAMVVLDHAIDNIITSIEREGRLENTLLVMTSDHGEYPTRIHDVPRVLSLYEEFVRVPLLVRVPEDWRDRYPDRVAALRANTRRNVANVDIARSIIDLLQFDESDATLPLRQRLTGYSLLRHVPVDRTIITLNNNAVRHWEHKGFGLVWRDWRLVFTDIEGPRLFDISEDPRQLNNRWGRAPNDVRNHLLRQIGQNRTLSEIWNDFGPGSRL